MILSFYWILSPITQVLKYKFLHLITQPIFRVTATRCCMT